MRTWLLWQNGELSSLDEYFHEEDPLDYTEAVEDVELPGDLYADQKSGEALMLCGVPFHAGYISSAWVCESHNCSHANDACHQCVVTVRVHGGYAGLRQPAGKVAAAECFVHGGSHNIHGSMVSTTCFRSNRYLQQRASR